MIALVPLFVVALVVHVALMLASIFLSNLGDALPFYGGTTGFLPSTGDDAHAYDKFSVWLSGGGPAIDDPGDAGGIGVLAWAVRTPLCGMVSVVKFILSLATLHLYDAIQIIPSDGFGNWFKIVIHILGALIAIGLIARIVDIAIRAGVFSNNTLLLLLLGVSILGSVATVLDAAGGLSCG